MKYVSHSTLRQMGADPQVTKPVQTSSIISVSPILRHVQQMFTAYFPSAQYGDHEPGVDTLFVRCHAATSVLWTMAERCMVGERMTCPNLVGMRR